MEGLTGKKHVIFDLDGTITKLNIDWLPWRATTRNMIAQVDPEFDFAVMGNLAIAQNEAIRRYGDHLLEAFWAFNLIYESESLNGHIPITPVVDFLKSTDLPASLWTTNTRPVALKVLTDLGLQDRFDLLVTRGDVKYIKPDPNGFHEIHRKLGLGLADYAFVGDSEHDRLAAETVGLHFIPVSMFTDSDPPVASLASN